MITLNFPGDSQTYSDNSQGLEAIRNAQDSKTAMFSIDIDGVEISCKDFFCIPEERERNHNI